MAQDIWFLMQISVVSAHLRPIVNVFINAWNHAIAGWQMLPQLPISWLASNCCKIEWQQFACIDLLYCCNLTIVLYEWKTNTKSTRHSTVLKASFTSMLSQLCRHTTLREKAGTMPVCFSYLFAWFQQHHHHHKRLQINHNRPWTKSRAARGNLTTTPDNQTEQEPNSDRIKAWATWNC
jgi:hypothetical protein